jgi:hypothetical protein
MMTGDRDPHSFEAGDPPISMPRPLAVQILDSLGDRGSKNWWLCCQRKVDNGMIKPYYSDENLV